MPWAQPEFITCSPSCSSRMIRSPLEKLRNVESTPAARWISQLRHLKKKKKDTYGSVLCSRPSRGLTGVGTVQQLDQLLGPRPEIVEEGHHQISDVLGVVGGERVLVSFDGGQSKTLALEFTPSGRVTFYYNQRLFTMHDKDNYQALPFIPFKIMWTIIKMIIFPDNVFFDISFAVDKWSLVSLH